MDSEQARALLEDEQRRLVEIKDELTEARANAQEESAQEPSSYSQHQADVGSDTFDRERDLTILDSVEGDLTDVEHALTRLDEGTYGTCEACGKAIADDRLEAQPATRFCLDDQAVAERERRVAAPHEIVVEDDDDAPGGDSRRSKA